jgi:multiple sugar transport system permease protein
MASVDMTSPPARAASPSGRRRRFGDETLPALGMTAPALVGLILFLAIPFVTAIYLSFTNRRLGSPLPTELVGLLNYERIFGSEEFVRALINNFVFALVVVPVQTAIALGLALLLNRKLRGMGFYRTVFFMPVVFSMALVSVVWILIYAPGPDGMLNSFLHTITFGTWDVNTDFLRSSTWALPAIIFMSMWQGAGFQMVIILAGLQGIPESLYEAAAIDKASPWKQFLYVTLPGLRNTLIFVVLVTTIFAFRLFDQVWIMTAGGPENATTTVMFEAVTAAFRRQQVARGAAMTVVFFVVVLGITLLQRRVLREEREIA